MTRYVTRATAGCDHSVREVAQMQREVAFMIRRQYADSDRDVQDMQDL